MIDNIVEQFGRLDYLVNSAGKTFYVDIKDLDGLQEDRWVVDG
jgi:NAD(P)-dependent dehydrogenase (short-subunit alcohol dehydrogenase family)